MLRSERLIKFSIGRNKSVSCAFGYCDSIKLLQGETCRLLGGVCRHFAWRGQGKTLMKWKFTVNRGLSRAIFFGLAAGAIAAPAAAVTTGSWNGYRWARTGVLNIPTVNRTSSIWSDYFAPALTGWSAASQINLVGSTGSYNPTCGAVYATIQVCSGSYGSNGWLGYANVWTSGGFIVKATVRLNDSYFGSAKYNNFAWRSSVFCQELGHTLGLAHNNTNRSDANTGSCMDYSNDPDGGGAYGASNLAPGSVDFTGLNIIYANLDKTQLAGTILKMSGEGLFLSGWHDDDHASGAVPEPGTWAMLIAGFGMTGAAIRRRRTLSVLG